MMESPPTDGKSDVPLALPFASQPKVFDLASEIKEKLVKGELLYEVDGGTSSAEDGGMSSAEDANGGGSSAEDHADDVGSAEDEKSTGTSDKSQAQIIIPLESPQDSPDINELVSKSERLIQDLEKTLETVRGDL
jgi:hypothetical protein